MGPFHAFGNKNTAGQKEQADCHGSKIQLLPRDHPDPLSIGPIQIKGMMYDHKPGGQKFHQIQIVAFLAKLTFQIKALFLLCNSTHIDTHSPILRYFVIFLL